jgi:signal transduction histidine kinase
VTGDILSAFPLGSSYPLLSEEVLTGDRLTNLLDGCRDAVLEIDDDFHIVTANQAAGVLLGLHHGSLPGLYLADLPPDNILTPFGPQLAEVLKTGNAVHFEEYDPPRDSWFEVYVYRTPCGLVVFFRDITHRRRLERCLADERARRKRIEERFEAALSVTPLVVFTLDRDLRYTWVYNNQVNAQDRSMSGRTPADFFDEETAATLTAFFRSVLEGGLSRRIEIRLRPKPGIEERHFITSAKPVVGESGQVAGLTGASIDITDIVRQREELAQAREEAMRAMARAEQASAAKTKFLAAASHDLRQPVQSLILLVNVLKERVSQAPPDSPAQHVVSLMGQSLDALFGLLDNLLNISKLDAGLIVANRQPMALGPLLARLAAEYRLRSQEKMLDLRFVPCGATVDCDPDLLERILRNLIENAIRYTPQGRILVGCRRSPDSLRVDVIDTGIGIAAHHLDSIFEEFFQVGNDARNRAQGLGLGLAIVQRLVHLVDASIAVRSRPGQGTCFSVTLPLSVGSADAPR